MNLEKYGYDVEVVKCGDIRFDGDNNFEENDRLHCYTHNTNKSMIFDFGIYRQSCKNNKYIYILAFGDLPKNIRQDFQIS